ncbi:MAG TPA: M28 family peptidase [Gemmatimonadaceae bacterium]|nr:M28 family peptidase [Gemmatimonadaceae bacterium]
MRRSAVVLVLLGVGCAPPRTGPAPATAARPSSAVTVEELRRDVYAFADDSMQGRETGTAGATRAMRFLVDRLQRLGLEPAGDSGFLQRVPMQQEVFGPATRIAVEEKGTVRPVKIGTEVIPLLNLGTGIPPTKRVADGEIVFLGYGLTLANPARDDLAGLSLQGKVVVVVNGAPAGVDSAKRAELESQAAISQRLARILPQGPAAIIVLLTGKGTDLFAQASPSVERAVTLQSNAPEVPESQRQIPLIMLGVPTVGSPLLPTGWPADDKSQVLTGRRLTARIEQVKTQFTGYNVAAIVRGSDPALRSTYVAFGAHYDHVGVGRPIAGDSISNGADDDASGSMALLAVARVMHEAPVKPARSMLFVWHVGEEKGLLGSAWFTDHPTVPIDSIVAQINADMIGRNADSLLYVVGPVAAPNNQSRRLGAIVDSVNATLTPRFAFNREWDNPAHPEHIYERSDHFNYAKKGIPIVFFTSGLHDDYHKPSDAPAKLDYAKMSRVTRLMMEVGRAVARSPQRPR